MPSVFITPDIKHLRVRNTAGIAQVVTRTADLFQRWEITDNPLKADLFAYHAGGDWEKNNLPPPDVAHCHGLYPTADPQLAAAQWHFEVNRRVIRDMRYARPFVTVPSNWVAHMVERNLLFSPRITRWAMPHERQAQSLNGGYVLWNKNREDGVCTSRWMDQLAARMPKTPFISTFGQKRMNTLIVGITPYEQMQKLVREASIYLATTKETGDIGSLEALSYGVPVVGFAHGALEDIIEHGVTGFLATPDDIDSLHEGLAWAITNRDMLIRNILNATGYPYDYSWHTVAEDFENLYDEALAEKRRPKTISVVIPAHNYGHFLTDAVESVRSQMCEVEFDIHVVDDASEDNTPEVVRDLGVPGTRLSKNVGVAQARNTGIHATTGDYVVCLDADDMLLPGFLQQCYETLESDKGLGVAYGKLELWIEGSTAPNGWPGAADPNGQINGRNQVPSACMFRRSAWEAVGGYRGRYTPAEDAELWTRMVWAGWGAELASNTPLYRYRLHPDSLSRKVKESNWWEDKKHLPLFGALSTPIGGFSHPVNSFDKPRFSIIIPVGPGHEAILSSALDSVFLQTAQDWECIVVFDAPAIPEGVMLPAWVKAFVTGEQAGASRARNVGLEKATGDFVVFLDADDELHEAYLDKTFQKFQMTGRYVYTDYVTEDAFGNIDRHTTPNFLPEHIFRVGFAHPITCLIPARQAKQIQFDETLTSFEDVDFYMNLIAEGLCGARLEEPLIKYRVATGRLRQHGLENKDERQALFAKRFPEYMVERKVPVCNCAEGIRVSSNQQNVDNEDMVLVTLTGGKTARTDFFGPITRRPYGRKKRGDTFYILKRDYRPEVFELAEFYEIEKEKAALP